MLQEVRDISSLAFVLRRASGGLTQTPASARYPSPPNKRTCPTLRLFDGEGVVGIQGIHRAAAIGQKGRCNCIDNSFRNLPSPDVVGERPVVGFSCLHHWSGDPRS